MIPIPSILSIFGLGSGKKKSEPIETGKSEFALGRQLGYQEGKKDAYKHLIEISTHIPKEDWDALIKLLTERDLILTYDLMTDGMQCRKIKPGYIVGSPKAEYKEKKEDYVLVREKNNGDIDIITPGNVLFETGIEGSKLVTRGVNIIAFGR